MNRAVALLRLMTRLAGAVKVPSVSPSWMTMGFRLKAESIDYPKAYELLPSINFCVSLLQGSIASLPLQFFAKGSDEPIEPTGATNGRGNIADIWSTANTEDTGYELVEQIVGSLLLAGNAYLFKDYDGSLPRRLWCLPPSNVVPVVGDNRITLAYDVSDGVEVIRIPRMQVVHFRMFNPRLEVEGVSPLEAARLAYETQRDASRFSREFYKRGGVVMGHYSTEFPLEPDEEDALRKQVQQRYSTPERAMDPVVLPRKLQYVRAGLTMQEMAFIETRGMTLEDILLVYRVPVMMAGIAKGSGLNSDMARVAWTMLHQHAVLPLATRIVKTITEKLLAPGEFGRNLEARFDFSGVLALQEIWLDQAKALAIATGAPVLTRNEGRERLGMEPKPDPEADELLVPISLSTGMAEPSEPEGEPEVEEPSSVPEAATRRPPAPTHERGDRREMLRGRADRLLQVAERRTREGFLRLFTRQQRRAIARLSGARARSVLDALQRDAQSDDPLPPDPGDLRWVKRLVRLTVEERGEAALAEIGAEVAFKLQSERVQRFIVSKATKAVTAINEVTRRELRDTLAEGVAQAESLGELRARVEEVFDGRRANALTIARTETAGAYNFGSVEAWDQSGVVESKEWLTAGDEAVRDEHQEAEGQIVALDAPFHVGGESLEYPGDPAGSAGNVINCRCTVLPVVAKRSRLRLGGRLALTNGNGKPMTVEEFLART